MKKTTSKSQKTRAFRRKLLAASTAAIAGIPVLCSALGLGEIQYQSYLGEPLKAEIDLVNLPADIDRANLKVRQVDRVEAEKLGVEIISNWHRFEFDVDTSKSNFQVQLNSRTPIKEPYINILVELAWPKGTLYREYTVFLDPAPTLAQSSVAQNSVAQSSAAQRPAPQTVAVPQVRTTAASTEFVKRGVAEQAPAKPRAGQNSQAYRVSSGDTLYGIAHSLNEISGADVNSTVRWLFNNNPQAFIDGDMNKLVAGKVLVLPEGATISNNSVASQKTISVAPQQSEGKGRLVLEQAVKVEGKNELDLLAASAEGSMLEQLSTSRAVLDYLVKENRDLKDRLSYLESSEYLDTLKQLVELQKNEIADLREQINLAAIPTLAQKSGNDQQVLDEKAATVAAPVEKVSNTAGDSKTIARAGMATLSNPFDTKALERQSFWVYISTALAFALAALLALFVWRSRERETGPTTTATSFSSYPDQEQEISTPVYVYQDAKKEISIDEFLDVNVALAQKQASKQLEEVASNDFIIDEEISEVSVQRTSAQDANQHFEPVVSLREITEKVQQERSKVEYLQQRIKEKTDEYNQRKSEGYEEPKQVEEIEVDPELEKYLKF